MRLTVTQLMAQTGNLHCSRNGEALQLAYVNNTGCVAVCCVQLLLAGAGNEVTFIDALPATINIHPLAKLMLAPVEASLGIRVYCSLQALTCLLVDKDKVQVGGGTR